jgi:hypothetical protein
MARISWLWSFQFLLIGYALPMGSAWCLADEQQRVVQIVSAPPISQCGGTRWHLRFVSRSDGCAAINTLN